MVSESEARDKIIEMAMNEMALKRVGMPEDVATVIAFFASDKSKHITGEVIKVDGGQYI
jgi:3-oxoacyl-[acyl-carrier protein] reductase